MNAKDNNVVSQAPLTSIHGRSATGCSTHTRRSQRFRMRSAYTQLFCFFFSLFSTNVQILLRVMSYIITSYVFNEGYEKVVFLPAADLFICHCALAY